MKLLYVHKNTVLHRTGTGRTSENSGCSFCYSCYVLKEVLTFRKAKTWAKGIVSPYFQRLVLTTPSLAGKFFSQGGAATGDYFLPRSTVPTNNSKDNLLIPPIELWEGYAHTPAEYLANGRSDMGTMLNILEKAGESPQTLTQVLDFGCAAGRMLRFYPDTSGASELWGVDISAKHIAWCQQHLSPPYLFATSTTSPHLPFEDNYFDLVYCGSVFTHISDLADTWFLELRRILRKGGYAYITIHDKRTVELLYTEYKDTHRELYELIRRFDKRTSVRSQDYILFSTGADPHSQVFYDLEYLIQKWSRLAKIVSVTPEAYYYQTAILVQK
jgi:ubiquinone/menaquinone biosynthesis C-methylase UbiE